MASSSSSSSSGGSSLDPPGTVALAVTRVYPNLTFTAPVNLVHPPGDATRWFVVEQAGHVREFANNASTTAASVTDFADLTDRVTAGGELGLLDIAFPPGFPTDARVFAWYTATVGGQLVSHLSSFRLTTGNATVDRSTETVLITVNQPESNHKGGHLAFGPDGYLYLGLGDGGGSGDMHGTIGNAQNVNTLLGKLIRIDVNSATQPYGIPANNPYVANVYCNANGSGTAPCPEIYALGLRNPWRYSFDSVDGSLWIGDVGQDLWEEVDHVAQPAGAFAAFNFGWRCREGAHDYNTVCGSPTGLIEPVADYSHSVGTVITGGYVYRGTAIPALVGRYIFADSGSGKLWNIAGNTTATLQVNGGGLATGLALVSFAEGVNKEIYGVDYGSGNLYQITAP
jgi:glucose/arabinose dehydrogenase